jgi:uncharacterized protein (TIGR02145 family)
LTGLTANTLYYVRAYATNNGGIAYGNQRTFTTLDNPPSVTTTDVTNILLSTATSGGTVTSGATVTARGICWSTATNPTTANSHTTDGSGTGMFVSNLTGLTANTLYYVRAYAINNEGIGYGNEVTFTTLLNPILPSVITTNVTSITALTAASGGNVISDGGATVLLRGVCWSIVSNPTTTDNKTIDGGGTGTFTSSITGLIPNTTYFVRAYATNSVGTIYGNERSFTSQSGVISLTTTPVSSLTGVTAVSGGNITNDGGAAVTFRGVCWSTNANPTIYDSYTVDGSGTGMFVSNLTGLTANTFYYVRAYAINSVGTSYGNELTFTTFTSCPGIPSITYGGKTYYTLQIGTQCWLSENLNIGTRIDGFFGQNNNSTIEKYCYNDLESNCDVYGGLYQWGEMMQYIGTEGSQGICPTGWHIPTDAEWTTLTTYLGGESVAGGKMKEAGTAHWASPNEGATNSSGFTARAGGFRSIDGGYFLQIKEYAYFWSSSATWERGLNYFNDDVGRANAYSDIGISVRCVKD